MPDLSEIQKRHDRVGSTVKQVMDSANAFGGVGAVLAKQAEQRQKMIEDALDPLREMKKLAKEMKPLFDTQKIARAIGPSTGSRFSDIVAASFPRNLGLDFSKIGLPDYTKTKIPDLGKIAMPGLGLGLRTPLGRPALNLPPSSSTPTRRRKSRRRPGRKKAARKPVMKSAPEPEVKDEVAPVSISVDVAHSSACTIIVQGQVVAPKPSQLDAVIDVIKSPHVSTSIVAVTGWLVIGNPFTWIAAGVVGFCALFFVYEAMDLTVRKGKKPSTALRKAVRRYLGLRSRKRKK